MPRVLFVCLGNICRSPMAEGIFRHLVNQHGLEGSFVIDSAGTSAHHVGESPDRRMQKVAKKHRVSLAGQHSRQFLEADFRRFDYILAMDHSNLRNMLSLRPAGDKFNPVVKLMRDYDAENPGSAVPDPYWGGDDDFENVYQILWRSCENLLQEIREDWEI